MKLKAVIFDMDGVITDTAKIHFICWKKIFDEFLLKLAKKNKKYFAPFTESDYLQYVDGVSRTSGIKNFFTSRHIELAANKVNTHSLANKKTKLFMQAIDKSGVKVFDSTIILVKKLKRNGVKVAVVSASKNCKKILAKAKIINLFDVIVDGKVARRLELKSKPDPAIFLEAAKRLAVKPEEAIIVEDALAGIKAAKLGCFGLAIAIDRNKKRYAQFKTLGADYIVKDLTDFDYAKLKKIFSLLLPSAITNFSFIKNKLKGKKIILCLDFDGTLTPIVARPDLAILAKDMHNLLMELSEYFQLLIISGRELADIVNKVNIPNIYYAGNHGFEMKLPGFFPENIAKGLNYSEEINKAYYELAESLSSLKNCLIENKKYSLSVHYRLVESEQKIFIENKLNEIINKFPRLSKHRGKKVFEIRPKIAWHKGKVITHILQMLSPNDAEQYLPIYIGDDLTDEDAFVEIEKFGISILVTKKPKKSKAIYHLRDTKEVYDFLNNLQRVASQAGFTADFDLWSLSYKDFNPVQEKFREALCTLANGYLATRGAVEIAKADAIHYPGTYCAGCYNKLATNIANKNITNEDLVNLPNWLSLTFKTNDSLEWFNLVDFEILTYQKELFLQQGILKLVIRLKDNINRIIKITSVRFISMANAHIAALKFTFETENWSGMITIKSGLEGLVLNAGVARYEGLNNKHLEAVAAGSSKNTIYLLMRTNQSHIEIAEVARQKLYKNNKLFNLTTMLEKNDASIYQCYKTNIKPNEMLVLEKIVTFVTSRDRAISGPLNEAQTIINHHAEYDALLNAHISAWKNLWDYSDITINSQHNEQQIIRLHIFHLLQTITKHSIDLDIGVPARGLHGEAYRGHIFWDELFILPFYIFHFPDIARALLLYRYRRLNMARALAKQAGFKGAMYPWQSGSSGDEVSQKIHLNPFSNQWEPDYSSYQRHVNGAIVYNIWQYYLATNDISFMEEYGAEMILEIARFWAHIATYNNKTGRYEILNVVGPDEYHEQYPNSHNPGLKNNAYTNVIAAWSIEKALEILNFPCTFRKQELIEKLQITEEEIIAWQAVATKIFIPFHDDDLISQFEGYELLSELDWQAYRAKYGNIERLDRILKAEGDTPNNYKVSKQADVLMLFYLFSPKELSKIFKQLGYRFTHTMLKKNIEYYAKRVSHGSTLSKLVFASVYYYVNQNTAMNYYKAALNSDYVFTENTTTHEGVHLGAMGGCINFIMQRFAGLSFEKKKLSFNPNLPKQITRVMFKLIYHGNWLTVLLEQNKLKLKIDANKKLKQVFYCNDSLYQLVPNKWITIDLK